MQTIHHVAMPFGNMTFISLDEKVSELALLPSFVTTLRFAPRENAADFSVVEFRYGIDFHGMDQCILRHNGSAIGVGQIDDNALSLIEENIAYALSLREVRTAIRKAVSPGLSVTGKPAVLERFTSKQREALRNSIYGATAIDKSSISITSDGAGGQVERVSLTLGDSVFLNTFPYHLPAPSATNKRLRGTIKVAGVTQNFSISRFNSMPFKEFVTPEVLQDAYSYARDRFNETAAGKALELSPILTFVDDNTELESTYNDSKEDAAE